MTSQYLTIHLLLKNSRLRFTARRNRAHDVTGGDEENVDTRNTRWYFDGFVSIFNSRTEIA